MDGRAHDLDSQLNQLSHNHLSSKVDTVLKSPLTKLCIGGVVSPFLFSTIWVENSGIVGKYILPNISLLSVCALAFELLN